MVSLLAENDGMVSIEKAVHQFDQLYNQVNDMTKIKLKCWLYYCQSRAKGAKTGLSFDNYQRYMQPLDYISMVRGICVDTSDLGGVEPSVAIICAWYNVQE
jgi:hypothetical protein